MSSNNHQTTIGRRPLPAFARTTLPILISLSFSLLFFLCCITRPALALQVESPVENVAYNSSTITVSYLTSSLSCRAFAESAQGGGPLFVPGVATCKNFSYDAVPGWNALILSDGDETKTVNFRVGAAVPSVVPAVAPDGSIAPLAASPLIPSADQNAPPGAPAGTPIRALPATGFDDPGLGLSADPADDGISSEGEASFADAEGESDALIDQQDPLLSLFGESSVSNGAITADRLHYDYPTGVAFTAYVRVRNVGTDPFITFVATALQSPIVSVRRVESRPMSIDAPLPGGGLKQVRRYAVQERRLSLRERVDARIERITDARHRSPREARGVSADDYVVPGEDAVYAVTLRAPLTSQDEFWFQAVSSDMAEGLDPFTNTNWSYVRAIALREAFGVNRTNQLVYLNLTGFTNEQIDNCTNEIRVSNDTYDDIPVRVIADGGNLTSGIFCTILFGANIIWNANETFYVYFGNPDATAPAAATDVNRRLNLTWVPSPVYFNTTDFGTAADTSDLLTPAIVDYDCDGVIDLAYGIDDGFGWWRRNTGTNAAPVWGTAVRIGAWDVGSNSAMKFADLFGNDGILDLVVGENTAGAMNYFQNTGTCAAPVWTARTPVNGSRNINTNTDPAVADFDGDGLLDTIWGSTNAFFNVSQNTNTTSFPSYNWGGFASPPNTGSTQNSPTSGDLNFDGTFDLIVGATNGFVYLLWNNGTTTSPSWFNAGSQRYNGTAANIDPGSNVKPALYDINGDGWLDLVLGETSGFISVNTVASNDGKYLINAPLNATDGQTNARPNVQQVNITPLAPYRNDTLNCSVNVTDESTTLQVDFTWSKDGILQPDLNGSAVCANGARCFNPVPVLPSDLSPGDVWTCTALATDGFWTALGESNSTILYSFLDYIILTTDSPIYYQGSIVGISGSGYPNSSTVNLTIDEISGVWSTLVATNASGGFQTTRQLLYGASLGQYNLTAFDVSNGTYTRSASFNVLERVAYVTTDQSVYTVNDTVGINGTLFSPFANVQLSIYDSATLKNGTIFPLLFATDGDGAFSYGWNSSGICSGNFTVEALDTNQTQYRANTTFLINSTQNRTFQYLTSTLTGNKVTPVLSNVLTSNNVRQGAGANIAPRGGYLLFTFNPAATPPTAQGVTYRLDVEQRRSATAVISYAMYLVNASGTYDLGCSGALTSTTDAIFPCDLTSFVFPGSTSVTVMVNYTTTLNVDGQVDYAYLNVSYYGDAPGCTLLGDEPVLPEVSSLALPLSPVTLNAGGVRSVSCNVTITDANGADDIIGANATFFTSPSTSESIPTNVSKYLNASCAATGSEGRSKNFTCTADIYYYAMNGTWMCNATGISNDGTASANATFFVDPLYALNVSPSLLNLGSVSAGLFSANTTASVTNIGNRPMNISVYGYGAAPNDDLAFWCGAAGINISLLRYSSVVTANFTQKVNLTSAPQQLNLTILAQNDSSLHTNQTYWQVYVPPLLNVFGQCNGTLVFEAQAAS